jgi:hypothetical protein
MKYKLFFALIFLFGNTIAEAKLVAYKFDKAAFYAVIKSGDKDEIENELVVVTSATISEKEAYEGFLLMRKAGLVGKPAERLRLFKAGRIKLETALLNDSENAEYHFLRLIIEEKAPKIVKYHSNIEADKQIVIKAYKNLPAVVQQAIVDYSKSSKILHQQDL